MPKPIIEEQGWEADEAEDSSWITLHRERESMARKYIKEMTEWLNSQIVMPEVLANINFTNQEYTNGSAKLAKVRSDYQRIVKEQSTDAWVRWFSGKLAASDADDKRGEEYTDRMILLLAQRAIVMKKANSRSNYDQWLYSFSTKSEQHPVDWYIRALRRVQDGTYDWFRSNS
jgi:hypothetical protein